VSLRGQSIDQANAAYQQFVRLNNLGSDKGATYDALYQCYQAYTAVVQNAAPQTTAYVQALNGLKEIYPYLQNGAAYNSANRQQQKALLFAQAFMDIPLMEPFRGVAFPRDDNFAKMAYFAASGTYNAHNYAKAIPYFRLYLSTGDTKYRKDVYTFMAKAYSNVRDYARAKVTYDEALTAYPTDFNLLSMAINCCIDSKDNDGLQKYVSRALTLKPTDNTLLNLQGKLYEETQQYQKALSLYIQMRSANPNSLEIAKHIALNYYNLGVTHLNIAQMEENDKTAKKDLKQAQEYFTAAATTLKQVLNSDPTSLKYLQALASSYASLGQKEAMEEVNRKIASLGGQVVAEHDAPAMLAFAGNTSMTAAPAVAYTPPQGQSRPTTNAATTNIAGSSTSADTGEMPLYSTFAKSYVESRLNTWQEKDPYETLQEYQTRVTEATRQAKIKELLTEAEREYIQLYTKNIKFNDLVLKPYDAENKVFLVESKYGELIVPVPRENNEARSFESSWNGMQFKSPEFYINNDRLTLSGLTFVTPTGKSYRYNGDKNLNYTETVVDVHFNALDGSMFAGNSSGNTTSKKHAKQEISVGRSDVDTNIPVTKGSNDRTFAVIISNEHYSMVAGVPMALNDGNTFSQYCEKTLAIPHNNIRQYSDASYGVMIRAIRDIEDIASAYNGDISVIFYYAGHGIPNEATKDAYLLPIDADGTQTEGCYSLKRLYGELGGLKAHAVYVFLDACFSGAQRDGGMLASARGVALKTRHEDPQGNMVIFSAASNDETAFPYREKGHGLFTYFLLKKLQESKGNVTLQELGDYVTTHVKQQSVVINRKSQTPNVAPSASMADIWKDLKLKP
jgi:tetratricopeptide (TPR) repeat protein